jgi:Uma2 family endonuclease
MNDAISGRITLEEYLALDAGTEERLEYRDGYAVAMATPTKRHERIAMNLVLAVGNAVRARGCDVFSGGAKVIAQSGDRLIPDFVVSCDERDLRRPEDSGENVVTHPSVVVEILSQATAADDLTGKFDAYATIPELTHYVVIDSRRRLIHVYERLAGGGFAMHGNVSRLTIPALGIDLASDDVYRGTQTPVVHDVSPLAVRALMEV